MDKDITPRIDKHTQQKLEILINSINNVYPSFPKLLVRSFSQGLFIALGATIGLSIVLAVITFILNRLGLTASLKEILPQITKY